MNARSPSLICHMRERRDARYSSKRHAQRNEVLRRRPVRRALVVGSFLLLLAAVVLVWGNASSGAIYLAVGLLFVAGVALLNVTMRAQWPDRALDERLVAVRDAAYRSSYRVVAAVTALGLLSVSVVWQTRSGFTLEPHHLRALLLAFVGLTFMMPTAVLAWREREI